MNQQEFYNDRLTFNPPRPEPPDDKPDWTFFGILVLVIVTLCGIPTALVVIGAYAIKVIWGL